MIIACSSIVGCVQLEKKSFFSFYTQMITALLCLLIAFVLIFISSRVSASTINCPSALNLKPTSQTKVPVSLYIEGTLSILQQSSKDENDFFIAPEVKLINSCSQSLTAKTFIAPLPERLNIFSSRSKENRSGAFINVSSADQKMAMEKKGPSWHAYVAPFSDLRFVGATVRLAHGLLTLDREINSVQDLVGKRIGLVMRPSSLRVLQEALLISVWDIYDQIIVKEYSPGEMSKALEQGEVDAIFLPVIRETKGKLLPINLDFNRRDLHWISISTKDVKNTIENTLILADHMVLPEVTQLANKEQDIGLITFDVAWFTFASTPDNVVYDFLQAVRHICPPGINSCSEISTDRLLLWPELETRLIHPGAQRFYKEQGVISYP